MVSLVLADTRAPPLSTSGQMTRYLALSTLVEDH